MPMAYFLLLPPPTTRVSSLGSYASIGRESDDEDEVSHLHPEGIVAPARKRSNVDDGTRRRPTIVLPATKEHLSGSEKLALARPLVVPYMIPLFFVYLAGTSHHFGLANEN